MNLETLAKPFIVADEWILRQYTKPVKKWEDKGHSKYSLALMSDAIASTFLTPSRFFDSRITSFLVPFLPYSLGFSFGPSTLGLFLGVSHTGLSESNGKKIISDPVSYYFDKMSRIIRMPELITGISLAGKGTFDIYNYLSNNEPSLSEGIKDFCFGMSLVFNSSAFYIKNSDPKILDKAPFWKAAYESLRDKMNSLVPEPPAPQPATRTIESYV